MSMSSSCERTEYAASLGRAAERHTAAGPRVLSVQPYTDLMITDLMITDASGKRHALPYSTQLG